MLFLKDHNRKLILIFFFFTLGEQVSCFLTLNIIPWLCIVSTVCHFLCLIVDWPLGWHSTVVLIWRMTRTLFYFEFGQCSHNMHRIWHVIKILKEADNKCDTVRLLLKITIKKSYPVHNICSQNLLNLETFYILNFK